MQGTNKGNDPGGCHRRALENTQRARLEELSILGKNRVGEQRCANQETEKKLGAERPHEGIGIHIPGTE